MPLRLRPDVKRVAGKHAGEILVDRFADLRGRRRDSDANGKWIRGRIKGDKPGGEIYIAEGAYAIPGIVKGRGWKKRTLVLLPEEEHLKKYGVRLGESESLLTNWLNENPGHLHFVENRKAGLMVTHESQSGLALNVLRAHQKGKLKMRDEEYRNWHQALYLAAARYADERGLRLVVAVPFVRNWTVETRGGEHVFHDPEWGAMYRRTLGNVARSLGVKPIKIEKTGELGFERNRDLDRSFFSRWEFYTLPTRP